MQLNFKKRSSNKIKTFFLEFSLANYYFKTFPFNYYFFLTIVK